MASPPDSRTDRRPSARRPTMREAAAQAGVSLSTVSRVVNGSPPVAPSATIGLVFEDVANPFLSLIHRAVEDVAAPRSVLTLAGSSDEDPGRERELTEGLLARRVDGLIVVPAPGDHSYLAHDLAAGITVVAQDPYGIGREAAELMFSRMDGYDGPPRHVTLPTPLVERGSGEIPPR